MNKLLSFNFPSAQQQYPISMKKSVVSPVPTGDDSKRVDNHGIAPPHYQSGVLDSCTTLPPSPKDSLMIASNPTCTNACKNCKSDECRGYPKRPFSRGKCYMTYSPSQNMWGPVCGDGGYNANWVRGNRLGVDYSYKKVFNRPEYRIDGAQYSKKNPVIVANSPYFPMIDYNYRFNDNWKTYPYYNLYKNGQPIYTYPYNVDGKKSPVGYEQPMDDGYEGYEDYEGFKNMNNNMLCNSIGILIFLSAVLIVWMK